MTIVHWQCQSKLCNYSLKLYTAVTHLNKDDYVSELTWRQWYEHSGYFQSFIKIRSRCTSIATVPARPQGRLTLLLRFTWITKFSSPSLSPETHSSSPPTNTSPFNKTFQVETSDTETNAINTNALRSPLHKKYSMLLQNCPEKGLLGAPATSPSALVPSQPQDFKDFKQGSKAGQS